MKIFIMTFISLLFIICGCTRDKKNNDDTEIKKSIYYNFAPTYHKDKDGVPWSNSNPTAPRSDETLEDAHRRLGIGTYQYSDYEQGYEEGYSDAERGRNRKY